MEKSYQFILGVIFLSICSPLAANVYPEKSKEHCRLMLSKILKVPVERSWRKRLAFKYKDLDFILENIDDFKLEIKSRFINQKKNNPNNMYGFDYSELGLPVINYINENLLIKIKEIEKKKPSNKNLRYLAILKNLNKQVEVIVQDKAVSYIDSFKYSSLFSKVIGYDQGSAISSVDRIALAQDRGVQGFKNKSLFELEELIKKDEISLFDEKSSQKSYKEGAGAFRAAFNNKDDLSIILVPTKQDLDTDVLFELLPHDIYLLGVTAKPIAADGYVRPSGDFFMHDLRHSSWIFYSLKHYYKVNNITKAEKKLLKDLSKKLLIKLNKEIENIKDENFRKALEHVSFNFHHDQGIPLLPSSYKSVNSGTMPYFSYFIKRVSKQDPGFRNPQKRIPEAYKWLQDFWGKYYEIEKNILNRETVSIEPGAKWISN